MNIFQKKLENSLDIKILQQIFIEYKHMIQYCLDICIEFIDFMVIGKKSLLYTGKSIQIYFELMNIKKMAKKY